MPYPPGPSASAWWTLYRWLRTPLELLDELSSRYGDTFTMRVAGLPPVVVTAEPESVRTLFAAGYDQVSAGEANVVLKPFLGEHSLLLLDNARHQRDRKLLMPPLHGERMQAYGRAMLDETDDELDQWPLGVPFAVHGPMQRITLRIIVRTVFGITDPAEREPWVRRMSELLEFGSRPDLLVPALQRDLGPWSPWGKFLRETAKADAVLLATIRARRAEYERGEPGGDDVLSMLVRAKDEHGNPMSDEELRDELGTLLVAGHETTATALAWSFDLLLHHPEELALLRDELRTATDESGRLVPERVAKLERLDAVAREVLRIRPVVPAVGRILKQPMKISGHMVPTGSLVLASIYLAGFRYGTYSSPEKFSPARFVDRRHALYEWFPFGGGMRRCIGMAFALYEQKMVLAAVLARAELFATEALAKPVRRSVTLSPGSGVPVVLRKRALRGAWVS